MLVITFTGSREIPPGCADILGHLIDQQPGELFVTGAAIGIDQAIATMIATRRPLAQQRIIVPRDRSRVDRYWISAMATNKNIEIIEMGRGSTYRDRNLALLGQPVLGWPEEIPQYIPATLMGFPPFPEDDVRSARSGSWQTIRLARAAAIPVVTHVLSELVVTA